MKTNLPYKMKNSEGHEFVFAGYENGHPLYRDNKGQLTHKFECAIKNYTVVEQDAPK